MEGASETVGRNVQPRMKARIIILMSLKGLQIYNLFSVVCDGVVSDTDHKICLLSTPKETSQYAR
jgi:hypothetical protein